MLAVLPVLHARPSTVMVPATRLHHVCSTCHSPTPSCPATSFRDEIWAAASHQGCQSCPLGQHVYVAHCAWQPAGSWWLGCQHQLPEVKKEKRWVMKVVTQRPPGWLLGSGTRGLLYLCLPQEAGLTQPRHYSQDSTTNHLVPPPRVPRAYRLPFLPGLQGWARTLALPLPQELLSRPSCTGHSP